MKSYDPITWKEYNPQQHKYICSQCNKHSIHLYTHNGLGKIPPSCFKCKVEGANIDIKDLDIFISKK